LENEKLKPVLNAADPRNVNMTNNNNNSHNSFHSQNRDSNHANLMTHSNNLPIRSNNNVIKSHSSTINRLNENPVKPIARFGEVKGVIDNNNNNSSTINSNSTNRNNNSSSTANSTKHSSSNASFADFECEEFVVESYDSDLDLPSENYDDSDLVTADLDFLLV
jgi:hypothetical protein